MKYVYVLTSSINDFYYEQFYLSASSLRLHNPDASIVVLLDSKTKEGLTDKRRGYEKVVSEIKTIEVPAELSQIEISRWLKTSMRRYIQGDFLFIDCDTIIAEDISSISGQNIIFGACLDCHSLLNRHYNRNLFIDNDKKLGFTSYISNKHINSGIIFCSDTPETHKIFERWHELWLYSKSKSILRDQPSLNMAIYENQSYFTELDGIWNCQITANYLPFIANAKIIHYFATSLFMYSSPYLLASDTIFKKIKEQGIIPDSIIKLLNCPKNAFVAETRIFAGENMFYVLDSDLFKSLFFFQKNMPMFYNFLNKLSSFFKKITKSFMIRRSRKEDSGIKNYN